MRAFLGEHAKVIITILVGLVLLTYLFSNNSDGFTKMMPKPTATYGTTTSKPTVQDIQSRHKPTITFLNTKLDTTKTYNLENKTQMQIQAENANGLGLSVKVTKILDQNSNSVSLTQVKSFKPNPGMYTITYHVEETYKGTKLATDKDCIFMAD